MSFEPLLTQDEEILRWSDVHRLVKLSRNTIRKLAAMEADLDTVLGGDN